MNAPGGRPSGFGRPFPARLPSYLRGRTGRALGTSLLVLPAVGYIVYRMVQNWEQVRTSPWSFRPGYLVLALLGYLLALGGVLWAWNYIIGKVSPLRRFAQNARFYCLSNLPRHIPGAIWYMAGRTFLYGQAGVPPSRTLAAIALEVLLTTVAGLLTYLFSLSLAGSLGGAPLRLGLALGLLALALGVLQPPLFNLILAFFLRRFGGREEVRITYRALLPPLLAYLLAWTLGGATLYAVILSVYEPLPWQEIPAVIGIWAAAGTPRSVFPISPHALEGAAGAFGGLAILPPEAVQHGGEPWALSSWPCFPKSGPSLWPSCSGFCSPVGIWLRPACRCYLGGGGGPIPRVSPVCRQRYVRIGPFPRASARRK